MRQPQGPRCGAEPPPFHPNTKGAQAARAAQARGVPEARCRAVAGEGLQDNNTQRERGHTEAKRATHDGRAKFDFGRKLPGAAEAGGRSKRK